MKPLPPELEPYRDRLMGLIPPERFRQVRIPRPDPAVLARYRRLPGATPLIADVLDALGIEGVIAGSRLRPVVPGRTIVGPALTLRYLPERTVPARAQHQGAAARLADRDLYAIAEPGDVAVFDAGGLEVSSLGELSALVATRRGLAGAVVWGGVRDVAAIRRLGFPVWSAHVTPRTGKHRLEAIEINGPVACAGVQVEPGDLVVADDTGVVVVPQRSIVEVLDRAEAAAAREERVIALVERDAPLSELRAVLPPSQW